MINCTTPGHVYWWYCSDIAAWAGKHLSPIIIWNIIVSWIETFMANPLILLQEQSHLLIYASSHYIIILFHWTSIALAWCDRHTLLINCSIGFWWPIAHALKSSVTTSFISLFAKHFTKLVCIFANRILNDAYHMKGRGKYHTYSVSFSKNPEISSFKLNWSWNQILISCYRGNSSFIQLHNWLALML